MRHMYHQNCIEMSNLVSMENCASTYCSLHFPDEMNTVVVKQALGSESHETQFIIKELKDLEES